MAVTISKLAIEFTANTRGFDAGVKKVRRGVGRFNEQVGDATGKLNRFDRAMVSFGGAARIQIRSLVGIAAALFTVDTAVRLVTSTLAGSFERLSNLRQRTVQFGVSPDELRAVHEFGRLFDASVIQIDQGIRTMQQRLGEGVRGRGELFEMFTAESLRNFNAQPFMDQVRNVGVDIARFIDEQGNQTAATNQLAKLFGEEVGPALLPAFLELGRSIREGTKDGDALEQQLQKILAFGGFEDFAGFVKFKQEVAQVTFAMERLADRAFGRVAVAMGPFFEKLAANEQLFDTLGKTANKFAESIVKFVEDPDAVQTFTDSIITLAEAMVFLVNETAELIRLIQVLFSSFRVPRSIEDFANTITKIADALQFENFNRANPGAPFGGPLVDTDALAPLAREGLGVVTGARGSGVPEAGGMIQSQFKSLFDRFGGNQLPTLEGLFGDPQRMIDEFSRDVGIPESSMGRARRMQREREASGGRADQLLNPQAGNQQDTGNVLGQMIIQQELTNRLLQQISDSSTILTVEGAA